MKSADKPGSVTACLPHTFLLRECQSTYLLRCSRFSSSTYSEYAFIGKSSSALYLHALASPRYEICEGGRLRQSFIWDIRHRIPQATYPGTTRAAPYVPLFGLAPGGVYPATDVTTSAVRSYRTISPLPPKGRYIFCGTFRRLTPPRCYLAPCPMEPGLSSPCGAAVWPTSRGIMGVIGVGVNEKPVFKLESPKHQ